MINRENLIKIGRAGDNTTNRETLDQIVRVVMSVYASELDVKSDRFENMNWSQSFIFTYSMRTFQFLQTFIIIIIRPLR